MKPQVADKGAMESGGLRVPGSNPGCPTMNNSLLQQRVASFYFKHLSTRRGMRHSFVTFPVCERTAVRWFSSAI
jgi:hypothetical protein